MAAYTDILSGWLRTRVSGLVICVIAFAILTTGVLSPLSLALRDTWFKVFSRSASGDVLVLQIDARSLRELETWPWPRSRHAVVLERLRHAGAEVVAFDIDFSSASVPLEDKALASSIERAAGNVVLASVVQPTGATNGSLLETLPLPAFATHALIGNANILNVTGVAREASLSVFGPDGSPRPSFAALVAQREFAANWLFTIDHSIDVTTIPRLSYVDVLKGRFDSKNVAGKRVIVGATAVELGDRVSVPVQGVIAGADLQAIISESILQDRMLVDTGLLGNALLVIATLMFLRPWQMQWGARTVALPAVMAIAGLLAISAVTFQVAGVLVDPIGGIVATAACIAWVGLLELATRSRTLLRERSTSTMRQMMITHIVEDSSDGIVVVRDTGKVELCNEQAARLLNVPQRALTGHSVESFLPEFDATVPSGDSVEGQGRTCDIRLDGPDGGYLIEMSVRRSRFDVMDDAAGTGATYLDIYTLRDVTAVRNARAAEQRAQEERLLAERAKTNFVANMSHELRTPLNAIIGFTEMLSNEVLGPVQQRAYVEHADIVVKSSHNLLAVINNVIEVARLDSDLVELNRENFPLVEAFDSALVLVRALTLYKEHDIRVAVAPEVTHIVSDARLLKQVIYNLLSNAVKFSPAGSRVSCSAWIEGSDVVIEIEDQGCGIDAGATPRLAELFGHAESAFSRPHDGLGIGLHLVKRCLEKLDGRLSFQTARGDGTRVRVVLPSAAVVELDTRASIALAG